MTVSQRDQILLQRFFDGELAAEEAMAFGQRLEHEPELRGARDELVEQRAGFAAGRELAFAPPVGFTASVLAEVRQLPSRIELQQAEATGRAVVLCRRVLLAAAILFGLGLCGHLGLFAGGRAATLEAAPDEIAREMERLDEVARALARSRAGESPGVVVPGASGRPR